MENLETELLRSGFISRKGFTSAPTYLNGKPHAVGKYFPTKKPAINEWTKVEIRQAKIGPKYMFSLTIKGETVWYVENADPRQFSDVLVYSSSPWYVAQAGSIRDLKIENFKPG